MRCPYCGRPGCVSCRSYIASGSAWPGTLSRAAGWSGTFLAIPGMHGFSEEGESQRGEPPLAMGSVRGARMFTAQTGGVSFTPDVNPVFPEPAQLAGNFGGTWLSGIAVHTAVCKV